MPPSFCVLNVAAVVFTLGAGALWTFASPFYSETENPEKYLQLDGYVEKHHKEAIDGLFPASIPETAADGNDGCGYTYPETTQYYYRFANVVEEDFEIIAQWQLPEQEYAAEKERLRAWQMPAVRTERGNWTCWYFCDTDETQTAGYFYQIFAFDDDTRMVRYIIACSLEELSPRYRNLDW